MSTESNNRIDKFLWAIRLFKTRSLATEACRAGRVKMNDEPLKASHEVKIGEIYTVSVDHIYRRVQVKALLSHRVGAPLVAQYATDLTPHEEYEKKELQRQAAFGIRDRGAGRPTKRERRDMERMRDDF